MSTEVVNEEVNEEVNALHLPLGFIAVLDRNVALKVSRKKRKKEKKKNIDCGIYSKAQLIITFVHKDLCYV